ncbi:MAG: HdeA family protein, partial [Motiliproteus sp.]|nr:HdeA family protein [Motiliproteus sp.]
MHRVLLASCFVFVSSFCLAQDDENRFAIKGAGSVTCQQYLNAWNAKGREYLVFGGWIDGYLTSYNQHQKNLFDVSPWQSAQLLANGLANYCKKNPNVKFFNAFSAMLKSLKPDGLEKYSPIVEVRFGEQRLLMYQDVVMR